MFYFSSLGIFGEILNFFFDPFSFDEGFIEELLGYNKKKAQEMEGKVKYFFLDIYTFYISFIPRFFKF
jgi:hypothetical protein